ncbi:MAG: hypothetical protein KJ065_11865 [Anaerolineae bacterium]|nr:hypothetical protein [Anaerolineae bacterium]
MAQPPRGSRTAPGVVHDLGDSSFSVSRGTSPGHRPGWGLALSGRIASKSTGDVAARQFRRLSTVMPVANMRQPVLSATGKN